MASSASDTWIWHPDWKEGAHADSAGGIVHFRRAIELETLPTEPVLIEITADTKYKLYINQQLISIGPVKGDEHLWFYDQVDIQPSLQTGENHFHVRVLRLDHGTSFATSFPRLPHAGLLIRSEFFNIKTSTDWEAAIDLTTRLPVDVEEDAFLHIYEDVDSRKDANIKWKAARELKFPVSHGISAPWKLSRRMIPSPKFESAKFKAIHNLRSSESLASWQGALLRPVSRGIRLGAGTSHRMHLEAENHISAFPNFKFQRPLTGGSVLKITYSECYEDQPYVVPWIRRKDDRRDTSKLLIGPEDKYVFSGKSGKEGPKLYKTAEEEEIFSPFHFRSLRFIALDITVSKDCDLIMNGISLTTTNYPLEVLAEFKTLNNRNATEELWKTSIHTLRNCMHDCYEDCPFYEQLQYAMDIRSSALFTYNLSGDDRLARQAMIQLHNSYQTSTGLTASRAPAHQYQIIPHFSLYWICMITDHFEYFKASEFARQFLPACDGVLDSFARRIDPKRNLVRSLDADTAQSQWDFVDWADAWKPFGIPPAGERTGFLSYTNMLYAYTLKRAADLLSALGRPGLSSEYLSRADCVVDAVRKHCFNGEFYTDGLASNFNPGEDLSRHSQVWAVLCGAMTGEKGQDILRKSLSSPNFTPTSISMSFYTLRALSFAGGSLYNDLFHSFWEPWRVQLAQGVTTWVEDSVSQRSDCHAWGSSPIYEYLVEVAGIQTNGEILMFQPRVELFPELEAKVPFVMMGKKGVACVKWKEKGDGVDVDLTLEIEEGKGTSITVNAFGQIQENFSQSVFHIK